MHLLDWLIILLPPLAVLMIGFYTQRHMKSVAHFMSGGRLGGRYLLAVAKGEMLAGAVVFVAFWELFSKAGFVPTWWSWITVPVGLVVAIFGFVIYRFRETRAMTLAQFFEMRYSRNFRSFTGVLGFVAGVLNFGIIPAVGARFMVYFLQLPDQLQLLGATVPTYIVLMGLFLAVTVAITLSGGLVTLMVTDCIEGIFSQLMYLVIIVGVLCTIKWSQMETVLAARPPGHSLVNPFDAWKVQDFNLWYTLMGVFLSTYGTMAWQNASAYNAAAASPHEARMGGLLGRWRESGKAVVVVLLAAAGMTFLQHADFATASAAARDSIAAIPNAQVQTQMTIPIALSHVLPVGIKGALCAVLLLGIFGGDSTHLHSWGGILAQDVILPRLKKPPTPTQHIRLLRACILFVALFAFGFGCFFTQTEYILMWWQVTTAVYVGGAGACIIGGLYWKKGTTAGAWTAMITGAVLCGGGIVAYKLFGDTFLWQWVSALVPGIPEFDLNGFQISFFATLIAIALYVGVSLLTCREPYPLNKMLHRDEHAPVTKKKITFARVLGIDENFTRADKIITGSLFVWSVTWFSVLVIGTLWNLIAPWPNSRWVAFWHVVGIGLPIVLTVVTGVWFTWGGVRDIRRLFAALKGAQIDNSDNGTVEKHKPW